MKLLVIYNQQAGPVYYNQKKSIIKFLEISQVEFAVHDIQIDGSFLDKNPNDYSKIICVGGDGTIKEVASWIVRGNSSAPLAIIPKGTGNVVAQSIGIPLNTNKALEIALKGTVRPIDVGLLNKREHFLLAVGIGLDAKTIKNTSRRLKKFIGIIAYLIGMIRSFFNLHKERVFIKSEEFEGTVNAHSIFISNIRIFFNITINPESKMDDGYLNVSIFKSLTLMDFIARAKMFLEGNYNKDKRYTHFKTKSIYILPHTKHMPIQVDGEIVELPYLDLQVLHHALNIVTNQETI